MPSRGEGLSIAAAEAMCMGLWVVAVGKKKKSVR